MSWFRWQHAGLLLEVQVQPGARKDEFAGLHGERLKIKIHAPASDGRANQHLIDFLAACFGTAKANVAILRGTTSRTKQVCIADVRQVPAALAALGLRSVA